MLNNCPNTAQWPKAQNWSAAAAHPLQGHLLALPGARPWGPGVQEPKRAQIGLQPTPFSGAFSGGAPMGPKGPGAHGPRGARRPGAQGLRS